MRRLVKFMVFCLCHTTIKIALRREYVFTGFDMSIVHLPFYRLAMSYKHET